MGELELYIVRYQHLPSCLQTTFPHDKQLLIRSCFVAWQLQERRPPKITESFEAPS